MKSMVVFALALVASTSTVSAQPARWSRYTIPQTGPVDFPSSIFTEEAGRPDGYGQRFRTADGRADLTIQAAPNVANNSPAAFLAKKHPPSRIQYKRVTPRFFAVSSYKGDKVCYDRCNFSGRLVHCVLINYPAAEEHAGDDVVTRMSLSLRGKQAATGSTTPSSAARAHSALRSAGTSPNFRITVASPKSPRRRIPAAAEGHCADMPGFRESASALITAAFGLKHRRLAGGEAVIGGQERQGDVVGDLAHLSRPRACLIARPPSPRRRCPAVPSVPLRA